MLTGETTTGARMTMRMRILSGSGHMLLVRLSRVSAAPWDFLISVDSPFLVYNLEVSVYTYMCQS